MLRLFLAAALLPALAFSTIRANAADPPADSLKVTGDVKKSESWTISRLKTEFAGQVKSMSYTLKGEKHTAHAVPLRILIDTEGIRVNPHIKHHELQFHIDVTGHDGYTVAFSLAELLPEIGNRAVWVALDRDDKALPSNEGPPLDLIVPDDVKPARWVHGIVSVTVVDGAHTP